VKEGDRREGKRGDRMRYQGKLVEGIESGVQGGVEGNI
jgi:hypothetical protein